MSAAKPPAIRVSFDLGFAPDADSTKPGVLQDCYNFAPAERGMRALTEPLDRGMVTVPPTFSIESIIGYGYSLLDYSDDSTSEVAGTGTKLYFRDWFTGAWTDESRTAGYTANAALCWSFERFGDYVVGAALPNGASAATIPLQASQLSGPSLTPQFTDIAGSPTCSVVTSAERFVLAFNGRGGFIDSWSCCARDDHTSWTANPATLANTGRLNDPPGPVTAAIAFGNDVIAFKRRAMVYGRFVAGDAEVWKWERLPFTGGAHGPRAVCKIDDARIAFHGSDSCYVFDGARVHDVLDGKARAWFRRRRSQNSAYQHGCAYDSRTNSVWYTFPGLSEAGAGAGTLYGLVVSLSTGQIGRVELAVDIVAEMVDPNRTSLRTIGFFDSTLHRQYAFSASNDDTVAGATSPGFVGFDLPYLVSADVGDPQNFAGLDSVRLDAPYKASGVVAVEVMSRDTRFPGTDTVVLGSAIDGEYERFDARASAHWHKVRIEAQTALEIAGAWIGGSGLAGGRK